jgi:hypothetical protein
MKITNPYCYTIDEMKQIIAEWEEMGQIIDDYKASERIDDLTEEEFINLFGESTLYPNIYFAGPGEGYDYAYVSDYEWYLLENGINSFTGDFFNQDEWPAYHIIEGIDTIDPADVAQDLCWANANLTFGEALEQASNLDRFYLIIDENDNIIGSGLFDAGDNIEEYFRIKGFYDDLEFMKVEEPDTISLGELERSSVEDWEYYLSLRTKTIDVFVDDTSEATKLLNNDWDETVNLLKIHWEEGDHKFLVTVSDEEQNYYYQVLLESGESNSANTLFLGSGIHIESISDIIHFYRETGCALGFWSGRKAIESLKDEYRMGNKILSESKINLIIDLANKKYYDGKINMEVEQALMMMLSITHFFKFQMDYQKEWYNKHRNRMDNELEDFKNKESITNWKEEMDWIQKNGALQYHICIPDLLLQTLYTLNGSYYRINDRDYEWENSLYKILDEMPHGKEFDRAMLDFLLIPLYNITHDTNYVMQLAESKNKNVIHKKLT